MSELKEAVNPVQINELEEEIKTTETLVDTNKKDIVDLINDLTNTKEEIKETKKSSNENLNKMQDEINKLKKRFSSSIPPEENTISSHTTKFHTSSSFILRPSSIQVDNFQPGSVCPAPIQPPEAKNYTF